MTGDPSPGPVVPQVAAMRRALELAERGRSFTHPNPLVGAVLLHNGRIVAEGWHAACGRPHAEVEAIEAARGADFDRWSESTLVVTLEPCCHQGRTPPCTEAILGAGIPRVVFALDDPDHHVAGKGRARLESQGVRVERGVLAEEAARQNEAYLHHRRTGLPFVTWKTARTPEGATSWTPGLRTRITGVEADAWVDELRAHCDAVLVGGETARIDDPGLRIRTRPAPGRVPGAPEPPDPWRIILSTTGRVPPGSRLLTMNEDGRTLLVTGRERAIPDPGERKNLDVIAVMQDGPGLDLEAALESIAARGILSILCEAGDRLGRALLGEGLVRRLVLLEAPASSAPPGWIPTARQPLHADLLAIPGMRREDRIGPDRRVIIDLMPGRPAFA